MQFEPKQYANENPVPVVDHKKATESCVTANETVTMNSLFKEINFENQKSFSEVKVGDKRIMSRSIVLKDHKFGELQVVTDGIVSANYTFWNCSCSCGNIRVVEEKRLVSGKITACIDCEAKSKMSNAVSG
jgi:hypothetical protein